MGKGAKKAALVGKEETRSYIESDPTERKKLGVCMRIEQKVGQICAFSFVLRNLVSDCECSDPISDMFTRHTSRGRRRLSLSLSLCLSDTR